MSSISTNTDYISGELSEAFTRLDPDLAILYNDMKNAAAVLDRTSETAGDYDTIKYNFESAQTAYQTRLLEVRALKFKMASDAEKEHAQQRRELHELSMQSKMNDHFAAMRKKRLQEKQRKEQSSGSGGWLFYFLLGLWLAQMNQQMHRRFEEQNEMRADFAKAKTVK